MDGRPSCVLPWVDIGNGVDWSMLTARAQAGAAEVHDIGLDRVVLRRAIDALPPALRQALDLLRPQELSLSEASAEITEPRRGAMKVTLHCAVPALQAAFEAR